MGFRLCIAVWFFITADMYNLHLLPFWSSLTWPESTLVAYEASIALYLLIPLTGYNILLKLLALSSLDIPNLYLQWSIHIIITTRAQRCAILNIYKNCLFFVKENNILPLPKKNIKTIFPRGKYIFVKH